ncbi:sensor domain-containing diguanylate cyclase [Fusibacter bizertensis]
MRDGKKLLLYLSLILWIVVGAIALLQIPLEFVIGIDVKGYDLKDEILVYKAIDDDPIQFLEQYKQGTIQFEKYADTNYAGGLTGATYWFLIKKDMLDDFVKNHENELNLVEIGKPQLDQFTVYFLNNENGLASSKAYGRSLPFHARDYNHRDYFIKIPSIEPSGGVLFQVKTSSYLQFPIKLWHESEWIDHLNNDLIIHGLFYGALLIMLIYNIILGISIRDRNYIFFSFFILSFGLLQATWDGFAFQFLWPNNGIWDLHSNPVLINLVSVSFLAFTMNFMNLTKTTKRLKVAYSISSLLHGIAILCVFVIPSSMSVYLAMLNASCSFVLTLIAIILKKVSSRAEVIYLLAWQFFIATSLLNILAGFKIIPYTSITELSPKIAIIGLIALFSLALSEKLNIVEYLRGIESEKRVLLKTLHDMHVKISSTKEIHGVFVYLLDMFYGITYYEDGIIVLFDNDNRTLDVYDKKTNCIDCIQVDEELFVDVQEKLKERNEDKQWGEYLKKLSFLKGIEWESYDVIPLMNLDEPIGFIALGSKTQVVLDDTTRETINDFATQIAITIDNKRLLDNVTFQARHDFLTNAYNRRYFFEKASEVFDSVSEDEVLGTIMIDIDEFKKVNDVYGHLVGDEVLIQTVNRIKGNLRVTEILGRYGGEEFIVLLKEETKEAVYHLATSILKSFQNNPILIKHMGRTIELEITVSLGIAYSDENVTTLFMLTNAADNALYEAKRNGKNQIVIAK